MESSVQKTLDFLFQQYGGNPKSLKYSGLALEKYERRDLSGAIEDFTKAIHEHPSNQNLYFMRGTAYEDMGNDIDAEKDFRKTLEMESNNSIAQYRLGMIFSRKKDLVSAVKWLQKAYKNSPDIDDSLGLGKNNILFVAKKLIAHNLGNFLTQLKKFDEGLKYLDKAIELDSNYSNAYMTKGLALAQIGKIKEGIVSLKKAKDLGIHEASEVINMLNSQLTSTNNIVNKQQSTNKQLEKEYEMKMKEGITKELTGHLLASNSKMELVGTTLNLLQIIKEAVYTMAVNKIISDKQLAAEGLSHINTDNTTELLFVYVEDVLNSCFPNNFKSVHMDMVKRDYLDLLRSPNRINLINHHYQDLYDTSQTFV